MKHKSKVSTERKQYIVRKLVIARSLKEALRLSDTAPIEEVFINADWKEPPKETKVGFK